MNVQQKNCLQAPPGSRHVNLNSTMPCECSRRFSCIRPLQPCLASHHVPALAHIGAILENQTLVFIGDSITDEESCNMRCLLAPAFLKATPPRWTPLVFFKMPHNPRIHWEYHFQRGIRVAYFELGFPKVKRPDRWKLTRAMLQYADIVSMNIGSHFGIGTEHGPLELAAELQGFGAAFHSLQQFHHKRVPQLYVRLQNPAHFARPSPDGFFQAQLRHVNSTCVPRPDVNFRSDFRFVLQMDFARRFGGIPIDVTDESNDPSHHPGFQQNTGLPDCLHVCETGPLLTLWNSRLLQQIASVQVEPRVAAPERAAA